MTRTKLLALATGAAAVAIGAPAAFGHTRVIDSDVTLTYDQSGPNALWYGHVSSPRAKCVNNRRVRLYREAIGPDVVVGQDVTGSNPNTANNEYGIYTDNPPPDGTYYTRALRKVLFRSTRHKHVCAGAKSQTIGVGSGPVRSAP